MKFDVITLFPQLINEACSHSIIKRAIDTKIINITTTNPRDFSKDKHKKVDDTPYGGGAGMLLTPQPFLDAIDSVGLKNSYKKLMLSPQGERYTQDLAKELSQEDQLIIICGHYEGFDERIKILSGAKEISVGDFVMTGGEYPALCIIDSVTRLIEGAIGQTESFEFDSHYDGLLEYPHYTKPREYNGLKVPDVLLSGNHIEIAKWRRLQQFITTKNKRPDLFETFLKTDISAFDKKLINEYDI